MTSALVIVAHGSRSVSSNQEVRRLAEAVAAGAAWETVTWAFLQFAEPLVVDRLRDLAAEGVKDVTIVPLFLGAGRHVSEDLPEVVRQIGDESPGMRVRVTRHIGAWPGMAGAIVDLATEAMQRVSR